MRGPDVAFHEQRPQVRAPCISCPAQDLLQESPVGLHGTEKLSLLAALDVRAPSVADHPTGEELVVAGVELVLPKPVVMRETVEELGILENDGTVSGGSPRKTGKTAINMG